MTSNTNQRLMSVWGTSASSVWAVGLGGTAVYYNGIQWQVRPTPVDVQSDMLSSLSGTSDSNIFAVGNSTQTSNVGGAILHFDGTSWSEFGRVPVGGELHAVCIGAYADNDAFLWGYLIGSSQNETGVLYRVTNGTATQIMGVGAPGFYNATQCGIQVFSPTNIIVTSQTQVFQLDSVAKKATALGTASLLGQGGALWADASNDAFISFGANVERWAGGPSWANLSTGLNGALNAVSGTASNRVFAAGQNYTTTANVATVLFWNGIGWTVQSLPAGLPSLWGIWASPLPQGRVFAVGTGGTIVTGP
jgi:hypothetical protein